MTRMTQEEAAEALGLSESTLRYYRQHNKGPRSYKLGRKVFYNSEDVDAWLSEQMESTARGGLKEAA